MKSDEHFCPPFHRISRGKRVVAPLCCHFYAAHIVLTNYWMVIPFTLMRVQNRSVYDRRIVAYRIGASNNNQLVFDTFDDAVVANPGAHPLFHSDRGYQYTSKVFHTKLEGAHMRQSMSRVGRCIDNGPMEGFWGLLKSEMYYLHKFTSTDELTAAVENYLDFYNTRRYQKRLLCMTPMEFHNAA